MQGGTRGCPMTSRNSGAITRYERPKKHVGTCEQPTRSLKKSERNIFPALHACGHIRHELTTPSISVGTSVVLDLQLLLDDSANLDSK